MMTQEIIDRAIAGEEKAVSEVVNGYRPYIRKLSKESVVFPDGHVEYDVNSELEGELITHLLMAITKLGEKNGESVAEHR